MAKKLYVGNLPFNTSEDQIRELFSQVGDVQSVKIITDRDTGKSRGFCFVEMENAEEAVSTINGRELGGRQITVSEAREREERPGGGGGRGGFKKRFGPPR